METVCGIWNVSSEIDFEISMEEKVIEKNLTEYRFVLSWDTEEAKKNDSTIVFLYQQMMRSVAGRWVPSYRIRNMGACWHHSAPESMLSRFAPVTAMFGHNDMNVHTVAASEILKRVTINTGAEDDDLLKDIISLPMAQFNSADNYSFTIRVDERQIKLFKVLDDTRIWWEKTDNIDVMRTPLCARQPMYSSWYAYHTRISDRIIEEDCRVAAELGLKSVIIDDGWQVDKNPLGYAYCGDWNPVKSKFPDFKAHVQKVHDMGLKYILWFSVPFIGQYAEKWDTFKDKFLRIDGNKGVLDPRYPEVREYLTGVYEKFIKEYKLDGFKLDFIDSFCAPKNDVVKEGMDYTCVQEATSALMTEVRDTLLKYNPDLMIEFRQSYIGPGMRQFGNMFRVGDCQSDFYTNRVNITDIRLLQGSSAVHSDMITFAPDEAVEDSALQLINCLFGTLQYSIGSARLDEAHRKMSKFWINFMSEHIHLLQQSEFIPQDIQLGYPLIAVRDGSEELHAVYEKDRIIRMSENTAHIYIANGSCSDRVYAEFPAHTAWHVLIKNCMGETVSEANTTFSGISEIYLPKSGLAEFTRI